MVIVLIFTRLGSISPIIFYLIIYDLKIRSIKLSSKYLLPSNPAYFRRHSSDFIGSSCSWTLVAFGYRPANSYVYNATQKVSVFVYLHCCARYTFVYTADGLKRMPGRTSSRTSYHLPAAGLFQTPHT
jgi:hypothetical protein